MGNTGSSVAFGSPPHVRGHTAATFGPSPRERGTQVLLSPSVHPRVCGEHGCSLLHCLWAGESQSATKSLHWQDFPDSSFQVARWSKGWGNRVMTGVSAASPPGVGTPLPPQAPVRIPPAIREILGVESSRPCKQTQAYTASRLVKVVSQPMLNSRRRWRRTSAMARSRLPPRSPTSSAMLRSSTLATSKGS